MGWMACTFGPFIPWNTPASIARLESWDSADDQWELYKLDEDFSQANDLNEKCPRKLDKLKKEFLKLAEENKDFPIGAGNWLRLHPEDRLKTPYKSWRFSQNTRRMPEFAAPGIGRESTEVVMEIEVKDESNGVLYAVGGAGGGLVVYMDKGHLVYEYNMLIIERYFAKSLKPLAEGRHSLEIVTDIKGPGKSGFVTIAVDGNQVATTKLRRTVPAAFSATESFDVGIDLGSPVSPDYSEKRPFQFDGEILSMNVELK